MAHSDQQQRFGRYVVRGVLGRGAMGTVYRAIDPAIEREVAVKTLHPSLPKEVMTEVRERFLREAKAAGRLNHPNIVTIYDVGEQDGIAFIAMELLEGRSLQQMLKDGGRMPFATITDIAAQVADGLEYAHRLGVVHRDVKPANIVVSPSGRAKLADFGIAHLASSSMTQTGAALGSPKYMSPEQVLGQPVDPRSDIFSLGVVLYEMLVGHTPFERAEDTTVYAILNRIPVERHVPVVSIDPSVPSGYDRILARALAKAPADRYQRAADMAHALRTDPSLGATDERTAPVANPPERPAATTPDFGRTSTQLIAAMDDFARTFEEHEQARLRAEEAERLRKDAEVRAWGEQEERRREEFMRQRELGDQASAAPKRTSAIDMLRKQAEHREKKEDRAQRAAMAEKIDARLRAAFQYLSNFALELNRAHPIAGRAYGVMYLGDVQGVMLADAFTDYRSRSVEGRDFFDFVTFRYTVRCPQPTPVDVSGQMLPQVLDRLTSLHIPYESQEKRNELGAVTRARLTLSGPFTCQARLSGDYEAGGFVLDVINVRRYGELRLRFGLEELTDEVLDEFGTYVLGVDDTFARRLPPRVSGA